MWGTNWSSYTCAPAEEAHTANTGSCPLTSIPLNTRSPLQSRSTDPAALHHHSLFLPFCVGLWKVTRAMASPAKSPASVSGPDRTRWRRFPICPCVRTPFWTGCKTRPGCRWTAYTGRSCCTRRRARPGRAWRPATARPPRRSRCWRAAPRVDSPGTPTSRRSGPLLDYTTSTLGRGCCTCDRYVLVRHPALPPPPIWGLPCAVSPWGDAVCVLPCERCAGMRSA